MPISKNDSEIFTCIAPGKLIFIGEYAVLENAPALVAGVAVYAKAKIKKSNKPFSTFFSTNINETELNFIFEKKNVRFLDADSKNVFPFIRSLLCEFGSLNPNVLSHFELEVDTDNFYADNGLKYGLGSSAAATVAATYALAVFFNINMDKKSLLQITDRAHRNAQGMVGSGIDLAASVYGGIIRFSKSFTVKTPQIIKLPPDLFWMPVWTGKSASTGQLIKRINRFKLINRSGYEKIIRLMHRTSQKACLELAANKCGDFFNSISEYYNLMEELSIVSGIPVISEEHKKLAHIAQQSGAYYKPSGAGAGDFGLIFYRTETEKQQVIAYLKGTSFRILPLNLDVGGVRKLSN